jgi:hypothetical protein
MIVSEIELFEALAKELGREKAKSLVEYVESKVDKRLEESTNLFATKEDVANAKVEILRWTFGFFIIMILAIIGLYFKH